MKKKYTVGITGGIGSGKSFICQILQSMGYPIFFSDESAKGLLKSSKIVRKKVIKLLGKAAYSADGEIDRSYIASRIFSDQSLLTEINAIIHPEVRRDFKEWAHNQSAEIVFNEAAIIFETGGFTHFDKTILIVTPKETRIKRVLKRETISIDEIEKRMNNQWSDAQKKPLADFIVYNDDADMILPQINTILQDILAS